MSQNPGIPLPVPSELSRPYWEGCRQGVLKVQHCTGCDAYVFIPQPVCGQCFAEDSLSWVASSGRGTLYSVSQVHRPATPAFETPYTVAIIELEEGWHMLSNLVECDADAIEVGMPVEVTFREVSPEITLPVFRPTRS